MTDEANIYGYTSAAPETGLHNVIGTDAMVQSPTGFTQAVHMGELQQAQQNGMTTLNQHDVEMTMMHVEATVKAMQASGKTREEVVAAVGHLANGNPELAAVVTDAATKQYDSNKNPFAVPNADGQQAQPAQTLGALLGLAATAETAEQVSKDGEKFTLAGGVPARSAEKLVLDDHERSKMPDGRMASTGDVLANAGERGGFTPDPVPGASRDRGQAMARG